MSEVKVNFPHKIKVKVKVGDREYELEYDPARH